MTEWEMMGWGLIMLMALFAVVFFVARRVDNYGVVDVVWGFSFGGVVLFYALEGEGWPVRRMMLAVLVCLWSLRLGIHLARRVWSHHPEEDGRYVEMRESWKEGFVVKMFVFFQLQALSVVVLGIPFLLAAGDATPGLGLWEIFGVGLWVMAWIGESVADHQLARFKRNEASRKKVCDVGLWRYTRHPNYFCEWLIWVGFFLMGVGADWGWAGVIAPLGILYLLLRVTGVPATEEQALRSRGDAYRRYQARTNAFFPWAPKKTEEEQEG